MPEDFTPIPVDPPTVDGDHPHLDVEETLRLLYKHVAHMRRQKPVPQESSAALVDLEAVERKIARGSKIGSLLTGVLSSVVTIFAAGMFVAALKDSLATDDDVRAAIAEHNEIDPHTRDPVTMQEVGTHPTIKKRIDDDRTKINTNATDIATIRDLQVRMELRSEYQFEFARWQAKVAECRAKKCSAKDMEKPQRLEQIERDLLLGRAK